MKLLDRYIIREMIVPILIGTLVVTLLFQVNDYIYIAKSFNLDNIPLVARFQWILFRTPGFLKLTLPAATALAASLAMTRLAREAEITAMRAAGASILRIILPVVAFGAMMGVFEYVLVEKVVPPASKKANSIASANAILGLSKSTFRSNALVQLDRFAASFGEVTKQSDDSLRFRDVLLIDRSDGQASMLVVAKQGTYDNGVWRIPNSTLFRVEGLAISVAGAKDIVISQKMVIDQILSGGNFGTSDTSEIPGSELRERIEAAKKARLPSRAEEVELYQRFSIAASCAVFSLTSPIFAIFFARSGGFTGVLVSFVVVLLYYNVYVISNQILGKIEWMPAWGAAWLPNIMFLILGLFAIRRLE